MTFLLRRSMSFKVLRISTCRFRTGDDSATDSAGCVSANDVAWMKASSVFMLAISVFREFTITRISAISSVALDRAVLRESSRPRLVARQLEQTHPTSFNMVSKVSKTLPGSPVHHLWKQSLHISHITPGSSVSSRHTVQLIFV